MTQGAKGDLLTGNIGKRSEGSLVDFIAIQREIFLCPVFPISTNFLQIESITV